MTWKEFREAAFDLAPDEHLTTVKVEDQRRRRWKSAEKGVTTEYEMTFGIWWDGKWYEGPTPETALDMLRMVVSPPVSPAPESIGEVSP